MIRVLGWFNTKNPLGMPLRSWLLLVDFPFDDVEDEEVDDEDEEELDDEEKRDSDLVSNEPEKLLREGGEDWE